MCTAVLDALQTVARGDVLSEIQAEAFAISLMSGNVSPVQTAGVIAAMAARGERVSEIIGFAKAMRGRSSSIVVPYEVLDTCGTGGDGAKTFNISTAVAIICAAAGVKVAKHGNRAVSSKAGSADVLEALGATTDLSETEAIECLESTNLCFLFAPIYHPAMRHAAEARKQLGFRTIFNIVGPLTNPVGARHQIIGVFRPNLVSHVAHALTNLGTRHCLVVHGEDGIDEISISGPTKIAEVVDDQVYEYILTPEDVGIQRSSILQIKGGDANCNADIITSIMNGTRGPCRDIVALNAGAALYAADRTSSIQDGVNLALQLIDSKEALHYLQCFVEKTSSFGQARAVNE
jgi:anthranilate phosphoribosyltransferase